MFFPYLSLLLSCLFTSLAANENASVSSWEPVSSIEDLAVIVRNEFLDDYTMDLFLEAILDKALEEISHTMPLEEIKSECRATILQAEPLKQIFAESDLTSEEIARYRALSEDPLYQNYKAFLSTIRSKYQAKAKDLVQQIVTHQLAIKNMPEEFPSHAGILSLNKHNFNQEVLQATQPVVIAVTTVKSASYQRIRPVLAALTHSYQTEVKFAKFDADRFPDLAATYQVKAFPTLLFFQEGKLIDRYTGFGTYQQLEDKLLSLFPSTQ